MTNELTSEAARGVQTLFRGLTAGLPDGELLRKFLARDESSGSAFAVLVERHGPSVWGVCRRTLADPADALDAFQATFLILVEKAARIQVGESLGPWLHGVSLRVARRARANVARRRSRERTNADLPNRVAVEDGPIDDLRAVLDQELVRLPARYRSPLILCYLEGLTQEEAANRLGCPLGTVRSRLARGRGLLQSRLIRKGFGPSAVAGAIALEAGPVKASLPESLVASTARLAMTRSTAGAVPAALAAEVGRSMFLARGIRAMIVLATLCLTAGIVAAIMRRERREADDAPLPVVTIDQLAKKIQEAAGSYSRGVIETEYEEEGLDSKSSQLFRMIRMRSPDAMEPAPPKKVTTVKPTYNKGPGRTRHASDGNRWKADLDAFSLSSPIAPNGRLDRLQWTSGFDGTVHYRSEWSPRSVSIGDTAIGANELTPGFLFWRRAERDSIFDKIFVSKADISQRTVDGFRCYVVRTPHAEHVPDHEVLISPRQSYLPLSITQTEGGETKLSAKFLDLRKRPDGRWYPGRIIVEKRHQSEEAARWILESRRETRVVKFEPDHVFDPNEFEMVVPSNADVNDTRTGLVYRNDPWWPEVRNFLRKEFDWPRVDLNPLDALRSPDPTLEGRPAPPLLAARWLREGPVVWEKLRGKVVLLIFPQPGDTSIVPPLRRLKQAYRDGGFDFEVVEVFPSIYESDWASRYLAEYDVDHPVLYDTTVAGKHGGTCKAYGVGDFLAPKRVDPYRPNPTAAYVIDTEGLVRTIGESGWQKTLIEEFRRAGSKSARPVALPENLGGSRISKLREAWEGWAKAAPSSARLTGKVIDPRGNPVAGAKIQGRLYFTLLHGWKRTVVITASRIVEATTDTDGSFVISGLCKGNYAIDFVAPGLANSHRDVMIGPELGDIAVKLVLAQNDTISGSVLDEVGRPVPGATAELFGRHYDAGGDLTNHPLELKKTDTTDAAGRFRVEGILEGRYSLKISAEGRISQTREEIPAGASDLRFELKSEAIEKAP